MAEIACTIMPHAAEPAHQILDTDMTRILIIGCGDIGRRTARLWQARGARVFALARSDASSTQLKQLGIEPLSGDLDRPASLAGLPYAGALLCYFAPPPPDGHTDPRLRAVLHAIAPGARPQKIIYISTTGVYGDSHGAWVDEESPVQPQAARSKRRLDAETVLRAWGREHNVPVIILRVPGIYGDGRLPLDTVRAQRPVLDEAESGYTNRIHADDLARVCLAAAERGGADRIYNVSDGHPSSMTAYFNTLADRLGVPRPPVVARAEAHKLFSAGMLSYLNESRRISNRRMLDELGIELLYPTLEAGLAASLNKDTD
jgi:nucleoside-diphosphate-sugar epimerase